MVKSTIISDELKNMVKASIQSNPVIECVDMNVHRRFCVGNVMIVILPDNSIMSYLPDNFTKEQSAMWRADVGGVLLKELRKTEKLLFEHISDKFKVLIKRVREDERDDLEAKKLIHFTLGDYDYVIIKAAKLTDTFYINNVHTEVYSTSTEDSDTEEESLYIIEELEQVEENDSYQLF